MPKLSFVFRSACFYVHCTWSSGLAFLSNIMLLGFIYFITYSSGSFIFHCYIIFKYVTLPQFCIYLLLDTGWLSVFWHSKEYCYKHFSPLALCSWARVSLGHTPWSRISGCRDSAVLNSGRYAEQITRAVTPLCTPQSNAYEYSLHFPGYWCRETFFHIFKHSSPEMYVHISFCLDFLVICFCRGSL